MRIKALKSFASKDIAPTPGQVFDCSDVLAKDLIDAGYAEKVEEKPVATSQQPQEPATIKEEKKATEKVEEKKNENKPGNKKHAVSTAKGKRAGSK
jgi:hypothetical protein